MAGRTSGVQARIKKQQPMAVFAHCAAHRLNLATLTAVTPKLKSTLGEAFGVIRVHPRLSQAFGHVRQGAG